ncbi:hypothetical protein [Nodularia sphaerocarpa]|nr:hypothetical protein [Nodularia sphaerocarpa]MDB9373829.1 hypothetical protein [Nodularia sphaerocarpa CS-585]MDB9377218.1 hypothetical protein [Nodularia sphaerocarpa CS-585A2]
MTLLKEYCFAAQTLFAVVLMVKRQVSTKKNDPQKVPYVNATVPAL